MTVRPNLNGMSITWDPDQYSRFADDRGRPFFDLLARVAAESPRRIVDLGCGPGNLTASLGDRWPAADILGVDSSPEMIARAESQERSEGFGHLRFEIGDIRNWQPTADVELLVSNAALQWVPTHRELLRQWADALPSGAWLAWQVPGNFGAPSHTLLRDLALSNRWGLAGVHRLIDPVGTAADYASLLLDSGWSADSWETTYVHVLQGDDAVLQWVRGTTLGPIRTALGADRMREFEKEYADLLGEVYPAGAAGTLYPFRRIFAVGHKP